MPDLLAAKMIDLSTFLSHPRVVATVHQPEDLAWLRQAPAISEQCDLLEFRLDNLRHHLEEVRETMRASSVPCLITARHPEEGGAGNLDEETRKDLLADFMPHAALLDMEIRSLPAMSDLIAEAKSLGAGIVASCHDFGKTLPEADLKAAMTAAQAGSADVVKIAMTLNSMQDLASLALLTESAVADGTRISAMGMGRFGKVSRLVLAAAGSCLNYGYLRVANAPGQWPAAELKRLIQEVA
ncbi:MAG: type I 3-dehydroquinate dehydratase [Verrucomicrobiae bacterium]|nr:type I 3-dehydroquinate dehydratase [Verrucomicrobiae bacterium]